MFYSRTIENFALANMTVSDGVESVAQRGGGEPARPPLNPLLVIHGMLARGLLITTDRVQSLNVTVAF